jgi:hypothetical protein
MSQLQLLQASAATRADRGVPGVEVRQEGSLEAWEEELLEAADLAGLAPAEAWTVLGTNRQISYSTHGIFRYFGKFPAPIARHLIEEHTKLGDVVWDPTAGSGTTGVECLLLDRVSHLRDVNPLSLLLCKVKQRHVPANELVEAIDQLGARYKPLSTRDYDFEPVGLSNSSHWFLEETSNSLRGLRQLIQDETRQDIREFLWVAFASTVRRASRATTQQGRLFLDKGTALEDALPEFTKRAIAGAQTVDRLPISTSRSTVAHHDLRAPFEIERADEPKLVIIHPPYFNAYRYSSVNSLELAWLGFEHSEVRKAEIREYFKVGRPERVEMYVEDLAVSLANVAKVMPSGTPLGLMIGDTILKGEYIQTTRLLLGRLENAGTYEVNKVAIRVPRFTEATWVASQRRTANDIGIKLCDFVITLRRTSK